MTKKHYIAVAKIISESKDKQAVIEGLILYLKQDNHSFDEARFRIACKSKEIL